MKYKSTVSGQWASQRLWTQPSSPSVHRPVSPSEFWEKGLHTTSHEYWDKTLWFVSFHNIVHFLHANKTIYPNLCLPYFAYLKNKIREKILKVSQPKLKYIAF